MEYLRLIRRKLESNDVWAKNMTVELKGKNDGKYRASFANETNFKKQYQGHFLPNRIQNKYY